MLRSSTNASIYSYEARIGASLAQSFKYNFSFPSMYRRLKLTQLIQCYERKQIWSESRNKKWQCIGSKYGAEIPSKLNCAARNRMVP